ncbi:MAG: hypothetical protein Q9221_008500 [Calogaya cf. arnoldii]
MSTQPSAPVEPPGVFPAPPGVTPNYVNPEVKTYGFVPMTCVFLPLSTIFLILRLYTKARIIKILGWEDIAASLGWLCVVAMHGLFIRGFEIGNGAHIWNMTIDHIDEYVYILTSAVIISVPAANLPRVAVLVYYLRLNPARGFRYCTIAHSTDSSWDTILPATLSILE